MSIDPCFIVPDWSVTSLSSPTEFYSTLLTHIKSARTRITLSSLYLGTGPLEESLVAALHARLREEPQLYVAIHLDLPRALRRSNDTTTSSSSPWPVAKSSADLLLRLCRDPSSPNIVDTSVSCRVRIGLALLPRLRGPIARFIPPRFKEALGVWHAKAFAFDHKTVLLSGANLSNDYFTNRQDRYLLISKEYNKKGEKWGEQMGNFEENNNDFNNGISDLSKYIHTTIDAVATLPGSHILTADGRVAAVSSSSQSPSSLSTDHHHLQESFTPTLVNDTTIITPTVSTTSPLFASYEPLPFGSSLDNEYSKGLQKVLDNASNSSGNAGVFNIDIADNEILVRPRWQLGSIHVRSDENALHSLLDNLCSKNNNINNNNNDAKNNDNDTCDSLSIATGYFNAPISLQTALIDAAVRGASIHTLTADPLANGFWGARGVAGAIPLAFAAYLRDFYDAAVKKNALSQNSVHTPNARGLTLYEWSSSTGWTFHGKGVWLFKQYQGKILTTILAGSPNYGRRGLERDAEMQIEFSSKSKDFADRMKIERDRMWVRINSGAPIGAKTIAVGPHLAQNMGEPARDVWCPKTHPHRALRWRAAWSNGVWIHIGRRVLGAFF